MTDTRPTMTRRYGIFVPSVACYVLITFIRIFYKSRDSLFSPLETIESDCTVQQTQVRRVKFNPSDCSICPQLSCNGRQRTEVDSAPATGPLSLGVCVTVRLCVCCAPPEGVTNRDCVLFTLTSSTVHCHLSLWGEISLWRESLPPGGRVEDRVEPPYNRSPKDWLLLQAQDC